MPCYDVTCAGCDKVIEVWTKMDHGGNFGVCKTCGDPFRQTYLTPRAIMSAPLGKRLRRLGQQEKNRVRERFEKRWNISKKTVIPV